MLGGDGGVMAALAVVAELCSAMFQPYQWKGTESLMGEGLGPAFWASVSNWRLSYQFHKFRPKSRYIVMM